MRPLLIGHLGLLVKAWARYQDEKTGLWYQIVDKGDNPEQLARDVELKHVHVRHCNGRRSWLRA